MQPKHRSLIYKFVLVTFLIGLVFMGIHFIVPPEHDTNLPQRYALPVLAVSLVTYVFYFRKLINKAGFYGDGKYYLPLAYFVGAVFTPAGFIYFAHFFSNPIATIETIREISTIKTEKFQISSVNPIPSAAFERFTHTLEPPEDSKETRHVFQYSTIVPLALNPQDSTFNTWIVLRPHFYVKGELTETNIEELKTQYLSEGKRYKDKYPYDSILFFTKATFGMELLRDQGKQYGFHTFLIPHNTSASTDFIIGISIFAGLYILIIIFFGLIVNDGDQQWKSSDYL